ncbi:MAG: hypothetical protein WDN06_01210 [Asticcacaulis sp.]
MLGKAAGRDYTTRMKTFGVARDYPADLLTHVLDQCEAHGLIAEELYDGKMPIVGLNDAEALRRLFKGEWGLAARQEPELRKARR